MKNIKNLWPIFVAFILLHGAIQATQTACVDADNDGYNAASCGGNDCNDNNASIHPGATETCDGLDNDCDGLTDGADPDFEGFTTTGVLMGTTPIGGTADNGTMFAINPVSGEYKIIKSFTGSDGISPSSSLIEYNGKFYGTTEIGGNAGRGVLYEFDPATRTLTGKKELSGDADGGNFSLTKLALYNNKLYGTTTAGGMNSGVLFEFDPATDIYTKKVDFNNIDGRTPAASWLTEYNGKLYGLTSQGGITFSDGVIFEFDPITGIYTKKHDFQNSDGREPYGYLTLFNGKLYGLTYAGGMYGNGVLFEYDPSANTYIKKLDFNGENGKSPTSNMVVHNNKLYGTTRLGGASDDGVLFEYDPVSNVYTKKMDFVANQGSYPTGALFMYNNKFYGLTGLGGAFSRGVIYEYDPLSNTYNNIHDFDLTNGSSPFYIQLMYADLPDLNTWFEDADSDGYGNPAITIRSPSMPPGYVCNALDNCPNIANPTQDNYDGDALGNACDPILSVCSAIDALIAAIQISSIPAQLKNALIAKLINAKEKYIAKNKNGAAGSLTGFIGQVNGQSGNQIPPDLAVKWVEIAEIIKDAILNGNTNCTTNEGFAAPSDGNIDAPEFISAEVLRVFPNPVSNTLYLDLHNFIEQYLSVVIQNHLGQQVLKLEVDESHESVLSIELDKLLLPNGIYILSVKNAEAQWTKQFVIAR